MVNPVSCYTARDSELQLHRASGCCHVWFLVPWQEGEGAQIFKIFITTGLGIQMWTG